MRKKKEQELQLPAEKPDYIELQSYDSYVNLIERTINGVFDKSIDAKTANAVGMLTGYGLNALREARGGKLKMSLFLSDMKKVNVESLSSEEMDRFLQGSEDVQVEVLQQLKDRGGIVEAEVVMTPKREQRPKLDVPLISQVSGIAPDAVRDALSGEGEKPVASVRKHEWTRTLGGTMRFCLNCGNEREMLQEEDMVAACSGDWGL